MILCHLKSPINITFFISKNAIPKNYYFLLFYTLSINTTTCRDWTFPHWRGTLTSKIAMREIPDPKSTMGEWYNIKSFPVFKKTGKLFPCFFCYIVTFLYYEGNYFPVFEGKSLPVFLLYRNISLLSRKIIPVFFCKFITEWNVCTYGIGSLTEYRCHMFIDLFKVNHSLSHYFHATHSLSEAWIIIHITNLRSWKIRFCYTRVN